MTFDNGLGLLSHYALRERGVNENINGLIRQEFPKETDFNKISNREISFVVNRLNNFLLKDSE